MADMWVRPIRQADIPLVSDWITKTKNNQFDPDTISYPETSVYCASDGEPVCYLPVQAVAMLESLATKPGTSKIKVARALAALIRSIALLASNKGLHEMYFLSGDPATVAFAKKHGFEDMTGAPDRCPHCSKRLPQPHAVTLRLKLDKIK